MIHEFETFEHAFFWIVEHALTRLHLKLMGADLVTNYRETGRYIICTIVTEQ